MIPVGNYTAKAVSAEFGISKEKKTKFVSVQFQIVGGQYEGQTIYWTGYFSEKTTERTVQSLQYAGCTFPNNDITDTTGLGSVTVPIVVEHENYVNDKGEAKTKAKVAWVNNPAGAISPEAQMDAAAKAAFRAAMVGTVASLKKPGTNGVAQKPVEDTPF